MYPNNPDKIDFYGKQTLGGHKTITSNDESHVHHLSADIDSIEDVINGIREKIGEKVRFILSIEDEDLHNNMTMMAFYENSELGKNVVLICAKTLASALAVLKVKGFKAYTTLLDNHLGKNETSEQTLDFWEKMGKILITSTTPDEVVKNLAERKVDGDNYQIIEKEDIFLTICGLSSPTINDSQIPKALKKAA